MSETKITKIKGQPSNGKNPIIAQSVPTTDLVSWRISACDRKMWSLYDQNNCSQDELINTIIPYLNNIEQYKWSYWLGGANAKKHHEISVSDLNKCAQDRLGELCIDANNILVLHLQGTHCLYGYITGGIYHILWYDKNHGDNPDCVCRSFKRGDKKKHQR